MNITDGFNIHHVTCSKKRGGERERERERELHTLFKEFDDMKFIKVMIPLQIVY